MTYCRQPRPSLRPGKLQSGLIGKGALGLCQHNRKASCMTPVSPDFSTTDLDVLKDATGRIAVMVTPDGKLDTDRKSVV